MHDDYWAKETERLINRPEHECLSHDPDDMGRYVKARASVKPIAAPEAKPLSDL